MKKYTKQISAFLDSNRSWSWMGLVACGLYGIEAPDRLVIAAASAAALLGFVTFIRSWDEVQ